MRKRRHHYVPKFYLRPWATGERIFCRRGNSIKAVGLRNVGVEEDFYEVKDIMPEDIEFLRLAIISKSSTGAQPIHEDLLRQFASVAVANRLMKTNPQAFVEEVQHEIRRAVSNLDEDYHTAIEHDLRYSIEQMLSGSTAFFDDVLIAGMFLRALALFSLRTKRVRERFRKQVQVPLPGFDLDRIYGPLIHILAINLGGSLLVSRDGFRLVLLHNETVVPFLTCDQPVLNICDDRDERGTPVEVYWYMPLSPTTAMLYVPVSFADTVSASISETEVRGYNERILKEHHDQMYGHTEESLMF